MEVAEFQKSLEEMPEEARKEFLAMWGEPEELHPDLALYKTTIQGWDWVKHPLVFSMMHHPALNRDLNKQYKHKYKLLMESEDKKDWIAAIFLHERPYRFEALSRMWDFMSDQEYWEALGAIWTDSENIWQNEEGWKDALVAHRVGRVQYFMEEGEREIYEYLPDVVTVHRGYSEDGRAEGLSWTLDPERAEFFAKRLVIDGQPRVVTGKVKREHVAAFFECRKEAEVVVFDPQWVFDREERVL